MVSLTVFGRTDLSALRQKIRRYVLALKHRGCAENNTRSSRFLNATVCRTLFQVNLFSFQNYQYRFFPHRLNCSHWSVVLSLATVVEKTASLRRDIPISKAPVAFFANDALVPFISFGFVDVWRAKTGTRRNPKENEDNMVGNQEKFKDITLLSLLKHNFPWFSFLKPCFHCFWKNIEELKGALQQMKKQQRTKRRKVHGHHYFHS